MDPAFAWIESSALSVWIRESNWAFPIVLIFHTVGLAFLVGVNVAVDVRLKDSTVLEASRAEAYLPPEGPRDIQRGIELARAHLAAFDRREQGR